MSIDAKKNIFHFININGLNERGIELSSLDRKVLFTMNDNKNLFITRTALRIALKEKNNFTQRLYESTNNNLNYETFIHMLVALDNEVNEEIGEML